MIFLWVFFLYLLHDKIVNAIAARHRACDEKLGAESLLKVSGGRVRIVEKPGYDMALPACSRQGRANSGAESCGFAQPGHTAAVFAQAYPVMSMCGACDARADTAP
jgi:hypothetical protein